MISFERPRRELVQGYECIDRPGVDRTFAVRVVVDPFAHTLIAEILDQNPAFPCVFCEDMRSAHPVVLEPVRDIEEWLRVLVRRRRMHQHCAPSGHTQAEIAAKTGIADKRGDFRPFPFGIAKKAM